MAIGEHEPLAGAHFPNDVLSHFKRPGSKLTQHCNVAGRLSGSRLDAAGGSVPPEQSTRSVAMHLINDPMAPGAVTEIGKIATPER